MKFNVRHGDLPLLYNYLVCLPMQEVEVEVPA